jgi:hypothetical protein
MLPAFADWSPASAALVLFLLGSAVLAVLAYVSAAVLIIVAASRRGAAP